MAGSTGQLVSSGQFGPFPLCGRDGSVGLHHPYEPVQHVVGGAAFATQSAAILPQPERKSLSRRDHPLKDERQQQPIPVQQHVSQYDCLQC